MQERLTRLLETICLLLCMVATASAQTASLWNEIGIGSAQNGGISSDPIGVGSVPAIAINPNNGDIYAAWASGNDEIYVRRWNGTSWGPVGVGSDVGAGVSQSPAFISETPRLVVRASDSHVFLVWREVLDPGPPLQAAIFAAQFDGSQWLSLGQVSAVGGPNQDDSLAAVGPDIILSNVFANGAMPIVAWTAISTGGDAVFVKRWTGLAWVELGAGSASSYQWPILGSAGQAIIVRGVNADDGGGGRYNTDGTVDSGDDHRQSCCVRLLLDPLGKPAVLFENGRRPFKATGGGNVATYPFGLHVRRFIGDNAPLAFLAWQEVGRVTGGQSVGANEKTQRDAAVAGLATGFSLRVAATTRADSATNVSLKVIQFTGSGWTTLPTLETGGDCFAGGSFSPSLALRRDGNLVVSWMRATSAGTNCDIYVRQSANVGGAFAWAELGGGSAVANGISSNLGISGLPALALDNRDGLDTAVAAWLDGSDVSQTAQVYIRRAQSPAPPLPLLSISDVAVFEGRNGITLMTFAIGLTSPAGAGGVTLTIRTADIRSNGNSARAGSDYATISALPVFIPFGQTSTTVQVKVFGDARIEPDEVFALRAFNVNGASGEGAIGTGTILNDDRP